MTDISPGKSNKLWVVTRMTLALLLIGFVLSKADLEQSLALLRNLSIPWLVCYALLFLFLTGLKSFQYYVLIAGKVSYLQVLNVVVLQNALTNYFASAAGIASYLTLLRAEHGVKLSRSAVAFLLTKIGDLIAIWLTLLISSFLVWQTIDEFHALVITLGAGIGFVLLIFFFTLLFRQKFVFLLQKMLVRLGLSQISIVQKGMNILATLSEFEQVKLLRTLWIVIILSAAYLLASIAWIYLGFLVFNFQQPTPAVAFVSTLMQLISYIPIQIFGGLGVAETSSLYFWSPFNIPSSELASVLLGLRILFYLLNLLPLLYLPVYSLFIEKSESNG